MTSSATTSSATSSVTIEELVIRIVALEQQIEKLSNKSNNSSQREMTDEDARKSLTDLRELSHNKCAEELKLSYGQIYSCRLQYTFRHIHKELETQGYKNPWKK